MTVVPWIRVAGPCMDEEVERLKKLGYAELRSMIGVEPVPALVELGRIGCKATLAVQESSRKKLTVTLSVIGPDERSMLSDGFTIMPRGKITPFYSDEYDD